MAPRIGAIDPSTLSGDQRAIYEAIRNGPRGYVPRVLEVLLDAPALLDRVQAIGAALRYGSCVPDEAREWATLCVAAEARSGYEWGEHEGPAILAGISRAQLDALLSGDDAGLDDGARELLEFCRALLAHGTPSAATLDRLDARFGRAGLTELTVLVGYYALIANGLRVAGVDDPLPTRTLT